MTKANTKGQSQFSHRVNRIAKLTSGICFCSLLLGASGSAFSADVSLYGVVDLGLNYSHLSGDGREDLDRFQMLSDQQYGSRWGLTGEEDLSESVKIGFILEDGFAADTGAESGQMFDRESSLFLKGSFGRVAFGRMGSINQGITSWTLVNNLSAFGTSYGSYVAQAGSFVSTAGIWDNMISYETPDMAGFKIYAQYSAGQQTDAAGAALKDTAENESKSDRYYVAGVSYSSSLLSGYLAVDSRNYRTAGTGADANQDDSLTVTFGANCGFAQTRVYVGAQYFDEVALSTLGGIVGTESPTKDLKVKGWGVGLSADHRIGAAKLMAGAAYVDAEQSDYQKVHQKEPRSFDLTRQVYSVGCEYDLTKRSNLYSVASYMRDEFEESGQSEKASNAFTVMLGLRHIF